MCVLALGSTYSFPSRPVSDKLEQAKQGFKDRQAEIEKLDNFVIVGGGAVGIEYAGVSRQVSVPYLCQMTRN